MKPSHAQSLQTSDGHVPNVEVDRKLSLFKMMLISREADHRENTLFRQGRGQFHVAGSGHEGLVGLAALVQKSDYIYPHYRDRALMLALGVPLYQIALDFYAKAESSSGGRQLVNHFSNRKLNIISAATPTGLQCLPAAGAAWAFKQQNNASVAFCLIGDASSRQGEFLEAIAFAIQESLPVVFIVEDNGYGISTPTKHTNSLKLGMIPKKALHELDGRNPYRLSESAAPIIDRVRKGYGPAILWVSLDRLSSHTASDDQQRYRTVQELEDIKDRDPLMSTKAVLIKDGVLSDNDFHQMDMDIRKFVKETYLRAELSRNPAPSDIENHIFEFQDESRAKSYLSAPYPEVDWNITTAWTHTMESILKEIPTAILFGEDIEDPKGGVFGLTKGLSSQYPGRVINSPLAEATIAGLASGLAVAGMLPIFELQFADFMGPAFNQIVNQIATLRWRSCGQYKCPLIIYAPCGSYISNGGPWHSQTNESWLAHAPGLKVVMPSNANDAAHALYNAAHGEDPVIILLPKRQLQVTVPYEDALRIYSDKAQIKREGDHVTVIAWGNCVPLAMAAAENLEEHRISCEVIDICSIVPCDWQTLHCSVQKTGRVVVVQEDNKTCSFGQAIISELCGQTKTWNSLFSAPELVARNDVHIGFHPSLESHVLPNVEKLCVKIRATLGQIHE